MYLTKCIIETVESGYGAYSIGDSHDYFIDCKINVADMALIMAAEGSGTFTDGTVVNSRRFGVMMHGGSGGTLTIDKGSVFNTSSTVIQVKSSSTNIIVDNAELNSESGVILQSIVNDDPNMAGGGPGGGAPGGPGGEMPAGGIPGRGMPGGTGGSGDVTATFRNVMLNGDIINGNTASSDVIINFENAAITGAITTALTSPVGKPSYEKYYLIGEMKSSYCATDDEYGMKVSLDKESSWVVDETSYLTGLTISDGAVITAPEGSSVTMTVDGIETGIKPGDYRGKIVLTVTKDIIVVYRDKTYKLRAAIDVEDGKYVPEKSVATAVVGGKVTDTSARDVKITSVGENFNGIIARGDSKFSYSIINPVINLTGNGGSDFVGYGAAIVSDGYSDVTVDNASISTRGVIRSAVVVRGNSTMQINDSNIEANNGILPEGITEPWNGSEGRVMMAVPWLLSLTGNCRATNLIAYGTAYYNNTHIKAQAWGVLSTDACKDVKLYATNCHIETVESGYGAYADGTSLDTFSGCRFDVTDYGMIITGGTGVFTDGTVVNSGRFGVMFHGNGNLKVDKGCAFNTKRAVIQVKSACPDIVVENSEFNSESGIILQAMKNDDPNKSGNGPNGLVLENLPFEIPPEDLKEDRTEVTATFRDMTMNGDIVNAMTTMGGMIVTFEETTITGAITTGTTTPVGEKPSVKTYYLIGEVNNTYCETDSEHGLKVSFDGNSTWVVDKTSYLTGLTVSRGATITAPKGYSVTMTVDGIDKPIKTGTYKGKIVLKVTRTS
jgi:hypothetical protein